MAARAAARAAWEAACRAARSAAHQAAGPAAIRAAREVPVRDATRANRSLVARLQSIGATTRNPKTYRSGSEAPQLVMRHELVLDELRSKKAFEEYKEKIRGRLLERDRRIADREKKIRELSAKLSKEVELRKNREKELEEKISSSATAAQYELIKYIAGPLGVGAVFAILVKANIPSIPTIQEVKEFVKGIHFPKSDVDESDDP